MLLLAPPDLELDEPFLVATNTPDSKLFWVRRWLRDERDLGLLGQP